MIKPRLGWLLLCIALPCLGAEQHLGVATCASSLCHGSAKPLTASAVQQNEYVTWSHFDPHARAYRLLLEPRSQTMAKRLGLGPAQEARVCLDCHAESAPARGPRFQVSDGIGCESCHGPAGRWLATHDDSPRVSHADNLANGLYPIEDPEARAQVCVACHVGDETRFASHRLMAAGHPRLSFELDTFTELWRTSGGREHFRRDADYEQRKPSPRASDVWIAGLMRATEAQLRFLRGAHYYNALPEFALYNCYSCHRSMRFAYSAGRGLASSLEPGALRLDDSRLVMLSAVFAAVDPKWNEELRARTATLHRAAGSSRAETATASLELSRLLERAGARLEQQPLSVEQKRAVLRALVAGARQGDYPDYVAAEQAAMAVVLLLAESGRDRSLKPEIDALFAALAQDDRYDAARFEKLMERVKE
ncbi:MAG TPA: multiheme c-type cytochrome [Steroidobacteraceae bacterium]|nr:multiheme c-type cytochrome [Steroidobacteraceae bacterium]